MGSSNLTEAGIGFKSTHNVELYFDPTIGPGMIQIGYIGPKLPTVKYET